jgi:hypothetical protein
LKAWPGHCKQKRLDKAGRILLILSSLRVMGTLVALNFMPLVFLKVLSPPQGVPHQAQMLSFRHTVLFQFPSHARRRDQKEGN